MRFPPALFTRHRRCFLIARFFGGALLAVGGGALLGVAMVWGAAQEFDRQCAVGVLTGEENCPSHRAEGRWGEGGKWNWQLSAVEEQ